MTNDLLQDLPALDRSSDTPLFRQIAEQVAGRVSAGRLAPGERLPAIRTLAAVLGVNRSTVQMAYRELESSGLVESRVGSGTRVRPAVRPMEGAASAEGTTDPGAGANGPWRARFTRATEDAFGLFLTAEADAQGADGAIDLERLMPDEALFPVLEFQESLERVLADEGPALLSYGPIGGHPRLREALARRFSDDGTPTSPEEVLLTSGAQQGIELCLRAFVEPGSGVILSAPTYHQMFGLLRGLGLAPRTVPEGPDGPDPERLAAELARADARLVYSMPTFHNPTGRTWSAAVRRRFLDATAGFRGPILEDDFEQELRFAGRPEPTLRSLSPEARVLSLGTFSKGLFPGARVGWVAGPRDVVDRLAALKRFSDLSSGVLMQAALADFMERGHYDAHLERMRAEISNRQAALARSLEEHLAGLATWTRPEGGYAAWVVFPARIDSRALARRAREEGVAVAAGHLFDPEGGRSSGVRLTVARARAEEIERGVARLARAARELSDRPTTPRSVFV